MEVDPLWLGFIVAYPHDELDYDKSFFSVQSILNQFSMNFSKAFLFGTYVQRN